MGVLAPSLHRVYSLLTPDSVSIAIIVGLFSFCVARLCRGTFDSHNKSTHCIPVAVVLNIVSPLIAISV